jgi:aminomethyltransferase
MVNAPLGDALRKTPLYDAHVALEGKLVPFAGFEMPVQYPTGILAEHAAVRTSAGLFDVCHMGEFVLRGPEALDLIQKITINDASSLDVWQAQYSAMCLEHGGIIDDLLVYRGPDHYMLVVNGSNKEKDLAWVMKQAGDFDVEVSDQSDATALLAIQGPVAAEIVQGLTETKLDDIGYYRFALGSVAGVEGVISRTGYSGEDGFELYVPADGAMKLWDALMEAGADKDLTPTGLGCRDSLRLEMGYALYGNDLDEEHTPLESGLAWITKMDKGEFIGRDALAKQKAEGIHRRLVGLKLSERGFPRHGYPIAHEGEDVGVVTSGVVSPSLGFGVAMGYVPTELSKAGTEVGIRIRDKIVPAVVQRPPFYTEGSVRR